jgi:hypothetical protein
MYCMREVAELSKLANFAGGDYNFRADCTISLLRISTLLKFT